MNRLLPLIIILAEHTLTPINKILSIIILAGLVFNFTHSEIIDQIEGNSECKTMFDFCTLVKSASISTYSVNKILGNDYFLIDIIYQDYTYHSQNSNAFYQKHQNFNFHHLENPAIHIINQSFLI